MRCNDPRIVFISGHVFGKKCFASMLRVNAFMERNINPVLMISVQPNESIATVGIETLEALSEEFSVDHLFTNSVKDDRLVQPIRLANPDYILAVGISELLPSPLLDIPKTGLNASSRHSAAHGVLGMHPTLLPQGRGRAPIPWTIIKGLEKTGVTVFFLEEEADSGGIIMQSELNVRRRETATTLFESICELHESLGKMLTPLLACRDLQWAEQDHQQASVWPQRRPEDGWISFSESVDTIDRLIRAQTTPYTGAFFYYSDNKVTVNRANPIYGSLSEQPGRIIDITPSGMPTISCENGMIQCTDIENAQDLTFSVGDTVS